MSEWEIENDEGLMHIPPLSTRKIYISYTPIDEREAAAYRSGVEAAARVCQKIADEMLYTTVAYGAMECAAAIRALLPALPGPQGTADAGGAGA